MTNDTPEYDERLLTRREALQGGSAVVATTVGLDALTARAMAQSGGPTDEISGIVEDDNGAVQGATVAAVPHDETLAILEATTAADGTYTFSKSTLHTGDNLYHVIARDGTETDPRRGEQNYPFIMANGGIAIPDSGVLRWDFNEGSGSTATDAWGTNDGTISGATYTTDTAEGSHALSFDATDDDVQGSATEESTDGISFACWFRSSNTVDTLSAIKHETSGDSYVRLEGNITTGEMGIRFYDGSNTGLVETTSGILDGTYHHAVGTRASDGTVELYIDGSSVGTDASSTSAATLDGAFKVGQNQNNWWWGGEIDLVDVYNKVLSDTEVSNLYNTGSING